MGLTWSSESLGDATAVAKLLQETRKELLSFLIPESLFFNYRPKLIRG